VTPVEAAERALHADRKHDDPALWITRLSNDAVLTRARELEAEGARGRRFWGVPFAVKDNIDIGGLPTTAACPAYAYTPTATASAVQNLLDEGALLIGKTNLDQFATGLIGTRSPYGTPRNVFDPAYVPGGSSSGSACVVAAGIVPFALGTDTAGSGRIPAAFGNIVGLKPTRGSVSTRGVVPACRSLDTVSIFARTVDEAMSVLRAIAVHHAEDPYARAAPFAHLRRGPAPPQHLRITRDLAQRVLDFPLPDEADPAPVFRA
jgi:allophanate hydrolase